jgi:hypothetical protein
MFEYHGRTTTQSLTKPYSQICPQKLKDLPISPKPFFVFKIYPQITQFGAFCSKPMSSIFLIHFHLAKNFVAKLLLEIDHYKIPIVLHEQEDACSNSHIDCNSGSKLLNSSKLGNHKVYSK